MPFSPSASITMTVSQPANSKKSPTCIAMSLSGCFRFTCANADFVAYQQTKSFERSTSMRALLRQPLFSLHSVPATCGEKEEKVMDG